jgi:hypothetical protein
MNNGAVSRRVSGVIDRYRAERAGAVGREVNEKASATMNGAEL